MVLGQHRKRDRFAGDQQRHLWSLLKSVARPETEPSGCRHQRRGERQSGCGVSLMEYRVSVVAPDNQKRSNVVGTGQLGLRADMLD
jgi:hypothetical protein